MAAGDLIAEFLGVMPPATSSATPDIIVGAATPNERVGVWEFDDASDEYMDFLFQMKGYAAGNFAVHFKHAAVSATSGTARVGAAIRAIPDDAEDINTTPHSYDFNTTGVSPPSAVGEVAYDSIGFTNGADSDSVADLDLFIVRIMRDGDGTSGTDDMSGDWQLVADSISVREA